MSEPSNLIRTRITELPEDPAPSENSSVICVRDGKTYKANMLDIIDNIAIPNSRRVDTGTGLEGGGDLSADITLAISDTGVSAGGYGSSTQTVGITVNAQGQVTGLSNITCNPTTLTGTNSILFNSSAGLTAAPYQMVWNDTDKTIDLGINSDTTISLGKEQQYPPIVNKEGATIYNGSFVMADPLDIAQGNRIRCKLAVTDGTISSHLMLGVATADFANNAEGDIAYFGYVRGLSLSDMETNGIKPAGETWAEGEVLWANPALNGGYTNIEPIAPNLKIAVAVITSINGDILTIFVRPKFGQMLEELHNVETGTAAEGDILVYNSSTETWASGRQIGDGTNYTEFETNGFIKHTGEAKYWKDIDFPIIIRNTGVGIPTLTAIQGTILAPNWSVNDYTSCTGQELVHEWEEGSECFWHIHMVTNGLEVVDKYVNFQVEYCYVAPNGVMSAATTVSSGDFTIPANTTNKTMFIVPVASFVPAVTVGSQVYAKMTRIASTGTAPAANPWVTMLQLHILCDTAGSRTMIAK